MTIIAHQNVHVFATAIALTTFCGEALPQAKSEPEQMKLWKEIDIAAHSGTFPCLGDLNNDGKVAFLL